MDPKLTCLIGAHETAKELHKECFIVGVVDFFFRLGSSSEYDESMPRNWAKINPATFQIHFSAFPVEKVNIATLGLPP